MTDIEENTENKKILEHKDIDRILDQLIEKSRNHFYTYVKLISPEILPDGYQDGRHIELICEELQDVEASVVDPNRKSAKLQIFLPPGSMKSMLCKLFCSWCLGRHPNWCFIALAADERLAEDNYGRPIRDLLDTDQYQAIFPDTILKKDSTAAGRWNTTKRGAFIARGIEQNIQGRRANILIWDDVIGENTKRVEMENIKKRYHKGVRSRLLPTGAEIGVNTRWYVDDLSGFLLEKEKNSSRPWKVVSVPAILDEVASKWLRKKGDKEHPRCDADNAYAVGTSFWPELWSTEHLLSLKESMLPNDWNALYMQNPIPEEGNIIKRQHFKYWEQEVPPKCKYVVISLDTAFSVKETADYSAYSVWGVFDNILDSFDGDKIRLSCAVLLGSGKDRWEFPDLCNKVADLHSKFLADFLLIEDRASGQSLIQEMRRRGLPVVPYLPDKDKLTRLHACTPFFTAGRVYVPQNKDYAEELVADVCAYPAIAHDDIVDTVSQAILWLRDTSYVDNDGYPERESEVERMWNRQNRKTYWSSALAT